MYFPKLSKRYAFISVLFCVCVTFRFRRKDDAWDCVGFVLTLYIRSDTFVFCVDTAAVFIDYVHLTFWRQKSLKWSDFKRRFRSHLLTAENPNVIMFWEKHVARPLLGKTVELVEFVNALASNEVSLFDVAFFCFRATFSRSLPSKVFSFKQLSLRPVYLVLKNHKNAFIHRFVWHRFSVVFLLCKKAYWSIKKILVDLIP